MTTGSPKRAPTEDSRRTFVALYPSPEQHDAIAGITTRLARDVAEVARPRREAASGSRGDAPHARGSVRWTPPHQVHLTLAFLGEVPRRRWHDVTARVAEAAAGAEPFELAFRGIGAFPDVRRPRVVWLGVDAGRDAVVALAERVRDALGPLGPLQEGAFRPHLTLGRLRRRASSVERRAVGEALGRVPAEVAGGAATVREIAVMHSRLGADGAEHVAVARPRLAGDAPDRES